MLPVCAAASCLAAGGRVGGERDRERLRRRGERPEALGGEESRAARKGAGRRATVAPRDRERAGAAHDWPFSAADARARGRISDIFG